MDLASNQNINHAIIPKIADSGERVDFGTGAVREIGDKGRCDLMPLKVISEHYNNKVLTNIHNFTQTGCCDDLWRAIDRFSGEIKWGIETMLLEVAIQFENGAKKYTDDNWKYGIPIHCYIDSAIRHYLKWKREDDDEPHERAFVWNILCAIWTKENMPQLMDIKRDTDYIHLSKKEQ